MWTFLLLSTVCRSRRAQEEVLEKIFHLWIVSFVYFSVYFVTMGVFCDGRVQKQDDQHEHTFSSYARIRDAVLKTCLGRWTIGRSGERGSGISVLPARHDDDDDELYIAIQFSVNTVSMSKTVLFRIIQFNISTPFLFHFYFKLYSFIKQFSLA